MKKFDRDKYLKKLKFKRNLTKYGKYFYIGIPCLMITILGIYFAYSKFSVSKEEEVVRTTVGDFISGDAVIGAYIDGKHSSTIPGKNDGYIVDKIVCDNNATASWNNDAWGIVLTNLTKRTKCNVYFKKQLFLTEVITTAVSNSPSMFAVDDQGKNVRYIGANPSNYVYFNCSDYANPTADTCELWRIIGVFNNVTKGDGSKENLVKIIRDESIGNYSWDNKNKAAGAETDYGKNDWTTARLNYLLNPGHDSESVGGSLYYNAKSGTCYYGGDNATTSCNFTSIGLKNDTTRNAIEEVVWNLGGSSNKNDVTPSMFYERERGTTVYTGRPTTWTGKVGLMYPSDYGYATSGGTTKDREACLAKELLNWHSPDFSDCRGNDYLLDTNRWQCTLAPVSADAEGEADAGGVFRVGAAGNVAGDDARYSYLVRPALFLKSNIQVDKGTGAKSNPYRLKIQ